ncbi:unnamed protein product, partial [Polarella glacialis]
ELAERQERDAAVAAFLKQNGFSGVNTAKKSMMSSTYPLIKAAELGNEKLVAMLIKSGADVTLKNSSGKTAAEVAQKMDKNRSHAKVISALSAGGAGGA